MSKTWPLTAAIAIALVVTACAPASSEPASRPAAQQAQPAAPSAPQRELVVAVRGEPPNIAARRIVDFSGSLSRPRELFNATLDIKDERAQPRAELAEALPQLNTDSWRVFPDGRMETTYRLRANLTWHDGTALSAEDFVFGWRVYATPDFGTASSPPIGKMEEVVARDDRTLVIRWKEPFADAISLDRDFQALPRHILVEPFRELDSVAFTSLPFWSAEYVGLGPFRVTGWEPGAFIQGAAFDGYVLGRPKIDRVKVVFITDPQTALANMLAGEVHLVGDPLFGVTEGLTLEDHWSQDRGGMVLYSPAGKRTGVVQMRPDHVEHPGLLDQRVRRAIRHGFDVAAAVEHLFSGKALVNFLVISPGDDGFAEADHAIEKYAYDPRRAQQFMEEAGYQKGPNGLFARDGKSFEVSITSSAGERQEAETAVYVDSLRRAGFEAVQKVTSVQDIRDPRNRALIPGIQIRGGATRLLSYVSAQIPSPETRWHGDNRGAWSSPEFDRLYEAFLSTLDRSERVKQVAEMERLLNRDAAVIPLMFSPYVVPHVGALSGPVARTTPLPGGGGTFLHVHIWQWQS